MADQSRPPRSDRRSAFIARFARAQDGVTAIEFGLVALPFLVLFFAIIELGLVSLVSITLENAIIDAGRTIRTGEVQTNQETAAAFKTKVCTNIGWIGAATCGSALTLDVQRVPSFASGATLEKPATPCWDPGGPSSIVLVRAYYRWPLITPLLDTGLTSSDGVHEISAAALLANEPYSDTDAPAVTCPA
ncbi:TadE/TadG family type IV pilus assembly protein [Caulobacter sp. LARHSG274]